MLKKNVVKVTGRPHEVELIIIRNFEEEKVKAALQNAAGSEFKLTENYVRAIRPTYKEIQTASVKLPDVVAYQVIGKRGIMRIG